MLEPWCVWADFPTGEGAKSGWSRVAGDMTRHEAEWLAATLFFQAKAMPDAGPDHCYPCVAVAKQLCAERHPSNLGVPCEPCWEESRK